ncbi:MAG: hypothetical protein LBV18_00540 [Alistipes sp.]|jgi:hypothetical protein|nr:hypothetical protein [Alistipes sp.]
MKISKRLILALTAPAFLFASCKDDGGDQNPGTKATLSTDAPATITFNADGTGGMAAITVTTDQPEWSFELSPEDSWLSATKEGDKLNLVAEPNTAEEAAAPVTITFSAGDATEVTVIANQLGTDGPVRQAGFYAVDDLWPDSENPEGIVYWIDPETSTDGGLTGSYGYVMSLKQSPEVAWCLNRLQVDFGTNSDVDGRLNWSAVWAFDAANEEYTGSFEAFNWVKDNYDENWYLPSLQELRRFLSVYTGMTPEQTEKYMSGRRQYNVNQVFGDGEDFWNSEAAMAHREAYNEMLAAAGGDPMFVLNETNDPQMWSSTHYDETHPAIEQLPWYTGFLGGWGSSSTHEQHNVHYARAMRRFSADGYVPVIDELTATPTTLNFLTVDESVKSVTVTTTADDFEVHTATPWVHIVTSDDSFTVSVDEYTEAEAAPINYSNRQAFITVVSGNAPMVTVTVNQESPAKPGLEELDFEGEWSWTGESWSFGSFTSMSGTLEATYNEALGYWIFSNLPDVMANSTLFGDPQTDGGIALHVSTSNEVSFVVGDDLGMYHSLGGFMWRWYLNYATFFDKSGANVTGAAGFARESSISVDVSEDGNTLTFQAFGFDTDEEGTELDYGFGFGYVDVYTDGDPMPTTDMSAGAIFRNLVFTRVVE